MLTHTKLGPIGFEPTLLLSLPSLGSVTNRVRPQPHYIKRCQYINIDRTHLPRIFLSYCIIQFVHIQNVRDGEPTNEKGTAKMKISK